MAIIVLMDPIITSLPNVVEDWVKEAGLGWSQKKCIKTLML